MKRVLLTILYWLAVLIVSIAVLVALVLLIESRDQSSVEEDSSAALVAGLDSAPLTAV